MKRLFLLLSLLMFNSAYAGLDVTAYSELKAIKHSVLDKNGEPVNPKEVIFTKIDFPERFQGLKENQSYRFKQKFAFRAGTYSGFDWWRNELAKLAGNSPTKDDETGELRYDLTVWNNKSGAFWELIDFSASDSVISFQSCQRTYQDFLKFENLASQHESEDFRESYQNWKKAFAMCSNHGAIEFH